MEIILYLKGKFWQQNKKCSKEHGSVLYVCTLMEPEEHRRDPLPKSAFSMDF